MSSSLGGSINWDNLNSCTIQELKAACAEKNLRLEGKPTKARYVETLEEYKNAVLANETPKRRRGRQKSSQGTPAQSPAVAKSPAKQTAPETPAQKEAEEAPKREEVRQISPIITDRVASPVVQRASRQQSPVGKVCGLNSEIFNRFCLVFAIFLALSFLAALKATIFPKA